MKFSNHKIFMNEEEVSGIVKDIFLPAVNKFEIHFGFSAAASNPDSREPSIIVALGRGGFTPGVYLSNYTNIPLRPIMWQTRDASLTTYAGVIDEALKKGSHIIIIDDINDTGKTFHEVIKYYDNYGKYRKQIITMALIEKASSSFKCDVVGLRIDDPRWLVFPWELDTPLSS